jgi:DNA-binding GntR family transcriptional regulator
MPYSTQGMGRDGMADETARGTQSAAHWYQTIERVLRSRIATGALQDGAVLTIAPLAELFQVSRAPVHRALSQLEACGLVRRNGRRGFIVGTAAPTTGPDLRALGLHRPETPEEVLSSRGAWQRIYGEVETEVASYSIFGEFHVIEAELAKHFHVSRTVARDVLGRLHERGLIHKNQSSHWIIGLLTAQAVRERHALRRLLEPAALLSVCFSDGDMLESMFAKLSAAEGTVLSAREVDALEDEFYERLVLSTPNTLLAEAIRHNRLPLIATRRSLRQLGLPADAVLVAEHRLVAELLLRSSPAAAAAALDAHLVAAARRSVARLKTVAIIPDPVNLPPYLLRRRP